LPPRPGIIFPYLQALHLPRVRLDAIDTASLFEIPTLQSLEVEIASEINFTWPKLHLATAPSLTTLSLTVNHWDKTVLHNILQATPNLKILLYHFSGETNGPFSFRHRPKFKLYPDFDSINLSLRHVRSTLQSLTIGISWWKGTVYHVRPVSPPFSPEFLAGLKGTLGSLQNFPYLTFLQIPLVSLIHNQDLAGKASFRSHPLLNMNSLAWMSIPRSVQHITLTADSWAKCKFWKTKDWEQVVKNVLVNCEDRFLDLVDIRLPTEIVAGFPSLLDWLEGCGFLAAIDGKHSDTDFGLVRYVKI
jgi:hypothetical protein